MKWSAKVFLDAVLATIAGCFFGGILFGMLMKRDVFDAARPTESLQALAEVSLTYALVTLPFSLFFAIWLTVPAAYAMATLEKDGRPRSLLLHLLTPVSLAVALIVPPVLTVLAQQQELSAANLLNDPETRKQRLDFFGGLVIGVFFGSHVLLHGSSAATAFYFLRRWRLSGTDSSGAPPPPTVPVVGNPSAAKPWSKQTPWS